MDITVKDLTKQTMIRSSNRFIRHRACFVCFLALGPKSTTMVLAGWSVHLTTFLGKLEQAVNQLFMHILSLVTHSNPSWMNQQEENDRRNYFMINLHESIMYGTGAPGRYQTRDPWICSQTGICSQTCYRLRYALYESKHQQQSPIPTYLCLLLLHLHTVQVSSSLWHKYVSLVLGVSCLFEKIWNYFYLLISHYSL